MGPKKMRRGLFIGRFQPFHYGHLEAIRQALRECDELVIVVGSAQYSHTFENPFTAGERIEMIRLALRESGISLDRVIIVPVPDVGEHLIWVSKVKTFSPKFDVIYTNNSLVKRLFEEEGTEVKQPGLYRREIEMGTAIREKMLKGEPWDDLVPKSVAEYIREIRGDERLREVCRRRD